MAYVPVLAHAGHILIDLPIFLGPVLVLGGTLAYLNWRDRRRGVQDDDGQASSG